MSQLRRMNSINKFHQIIPQGSALKVSRRYTYENRSRLEISKISGVGKNVSLIGCFLRPAGLLRNDKKQELSGDGARSQTLTHVETPE